MCLVARNRVWGFDLDQARHSPGERVADRLSHRLAIGDLRCLGLGLALQHRTCPFNWPFLHTRNE